jgi:hypothetical protein
MRKECRGTVCDIEYWCGRLGLDAVPHDEQIDQNDVPIFSNVDHHDGHQQREDAHSKRPAEAAHARLPLAAVDPEEDGAADRCDA